MKFCWCTIMVKDLEKSLDFYQNILGLSIERQFKAGPGMEIAFLGDGETKVELVYNMNVKEVNIGEDISLGFVVENLNDMMSFINQKGISVHSGPFQPNPNTSFFYVKDPNGVKIQFVETKE